MSNVYNDVVIPLPRTFNAAGRPDHAKSRTCLTRDLGGASQSVGLAAATRRSFTGDTNQRCADAHKAHR